MAEREIIDAFLRGRIGPWGVFHRMRALGVSSAAALAIAAALPNVAVARNLGEIRELVAAFPEDEASLSRMLDHLADVLQRVGEGGPDRPLATSLARLVANNAELLNDPDSNGQLALNLDGSNFNLNGDLRLDPGNNNSVNLVLTGNVGAMSLNLEGSIDLPAVQRGLPAVQQGRNINLGNVNVNVEGNVGNMPINFNGNVGGGSSD